MSVVLPPWIITKKDPETFLRKFFVLHVNSYNIDLEIKDKHNIIQTPMLLLFQSKHKAKQFNRYNFDIYASKNTIIDSLEQKLINTITCDINKELPKDHIGFNAYEYVQVNEEEDNLLQLALFDNIQFFYVDTIQIVNRVLSMQGIILNSASFIESDSDPEILNNIYVEYFNRKLYMQY
jgi:hypothetical protein